MEKEIKIAELARIWDVSVNATWSRIKKEGLLTVKKLDNNREITFVTISDKTLNKYLVNNVNNNVNNVNYEDVLSDDNHSEPIENIDIIEKMMKYSNEVQERLISLNNAHNEVVNNLNNELIKYKEKLPLLEDKANREGLYLKEINDLKASKTFVQKWLITVIIFLFLLLMAVTGILIYKVLNPTIIEKTNTVETVKEIKVPTPQPKKH